MPKAELASQVVQNYEIGLSSLAEALEAAKSKQTKRKRPKYDDQALEVWRACIRD